MTITKPLVLALCLSLFAGACAADDAGVATPALSVECAPSTDIPDEGWLCPEPRTLTCEQVATATIFVAHGDALGCKDSAIALDDPGPFAPGPNFVTVRSDNGETCVAELTVVDETPPALTEHHLTLWPPNHKLHTLDVSDCVEAFDDCDGELRGTFLWATSDEPINANGDGNTAPDVILGDTCASIALRAERQGGSDGRVYRLGVGFTDRAGHFVEGICTVGVAHDQSGADPTASPDTYRVSFEDVACQP